MSSSAGEDERVSPSESSPGGASPEVLGSNTVAPEAAGYRYEPSQYNWVSMKVVDAKSKLSDGEVAELGTYVVAPLEQKWRLEHPGQLHACTMLPPQKIGYFFYKRCLELMGIKIPLLEFQQSILEHLLVAPSQLAPNAWGYVRAFEDVMLYLGRTASAKVFFSVFEVFYQPTEEDATRHGHVYLRGRRGRAYFFPVNDSNKGFKKSFIFVRAANRKAKRVIVDLEESEPAKPHFLLSWDDHHYDHPNKIFSVNPESLWGEDAKSFKALKE